jgi:archaea-specific DNA-binding protein
MLNYVIKKDISTRVRRILSKIGDFEVVEMSDNVIYIGRKPLINYCQAIIQTLHDNDTAKLLARGSAISRAVDAVEMTKNRYLDGVEVKSIKIGTDQFESANGERRNVSNMTIILEKQDK